VEKFEYIVLGTGFGGGTLAFRLAQAGKSVLVLERGRRWHGKNLPSTALDPASSAFPEPGDPDFFWSRKLMSPGQNRLGLYQLRQFRALQGLVAAGVGGGSLIWANVVVQAHEDGFCKTRWPAGINLDLLSPYYKRARSFLLPASIPRVGESAAAEIIPRAELLRVAAERLGKRWSPVEVAVRFGNTREAERNGFGNARQLGCNFCGLCSAGCPQGAKNSVDLSYIAAAEAAGAELRPLHEARLVEQVDDGYVLHVKRYDTEGRCLANLRMHARNLILACGTFGSTELLLRSRSQGMLRNLSPALGSKFSINGNVLSGALYHRGDGAGLANGPAVASMIEFGNYVVEDVANPSWAAGMVGGTQLSRAYHFLRAYLGFRMSPEQTAALAKNLLVFVGVGIDSANGRLKLNGLGQLCLDWPKLKNEPALRAQHEAQRAIAEALGREYVPDVFSTFGRQFTYHPLGGCPMADTADGGVVNQYGEVFGHPGLFIADGSIVPSALGRNPAYTICALAERVAEHMLA
jgi:cholesterol oxidase